MDDLISRQAVIDEVKRLHDVAWANWKETKISTNTMIDALKALPSVQLAQDLHSACADTISRQQAIDGADKIIERDTSGNNDVVKAMQAWKEYVKGLPAAQTEKETPKRVLWTGWKGYRDTRYKCPNCKKPVKNDDVYCHRCGQKLMFPHVDWTPYVEGQKQELIVRWDDE